MTDRLLLRLHGQLVGELAHTRDPSRMRLDLDPGWIPGYVTLSESLDLMPGARVSDEAISNFLGGYVPEGSHRTVMASKRGTDPGDLFALLREFGGSLAGAATVHEPEQPGRAAMPGSLEALSDGELAQRLRQAVRDTDQAVPDDSRSTLPGFQPKILVCQTTSGWAQPHGSMHSSHILKPQLDQRASRLVDEHYGHLLAQAAGTAAFSSSLQEVDGVAFLAIERFDRHVQPDGTVLPIHQEDLAQALGLDWRTSDPKFQDPHWLDNPARASAGRIAQLLGTLPDAGALLEAWVARFVFSLVLGDNDAHAKNIALLHTEDGTHLAPTYDVVPGLFQRGMIDEGFRLALAVNGSVDHRQVSVVAIQSEVSSWRVVSAGRARDLVEKALQAINSMPAPAGVSPGLVEKLAATTDALRAGRPIGMSDWQRQPERKMRALRSRGARTSRPGRQQ